MSYLSVYYCQFTLKSLNISDIILKTYNKLKTVNLMAGGKLDLRKTKTSRRKASVFYAAAITLLIWVPFFVVLRGTNEEYVRCERSYESKHFSDVATMGQTHILDCLGKMTQKVKDAGITLSLIGNDSEKIDSYFTMLYSSTEADLGLIFASDGSIIYGNKEYGSLFVETALEAQVSGGNSISELISCGDGVKRMGISSSFATPDGGTAAVVLLYSQPTLELMLENLNLSNNGRLFVVDTYGNFVLCYKTESQWIDEGQLALNKTGDVKEQLFTITGTKDGKQYMVSLKPVGINNWLVAYAVPKEQIDIEPNVGLTRARVLGLISLFFMLIMISYSFYRADLGERRMELFKKKFRIATSQSARAAFEYDRRTDRLTFISESEHVKLPKPYISLSELGNLVHPADRAAFLQSVTELRGQGTTSTTVRVFNFCGKEVYRWYRVTATLLTNKGEGKALTIGTAEDIDEHENERLVLYEKATTDSLTGLWNRSEIEKVVNERLSRLETNEHSVFAILDLDDFKDINDDFGHDCGDKALVFFADKLRFTFRFGDVLGRLGGDEFVVYMTLTAEKDIVERRLRELMENMLLRGEDECDMPPITCSIGCCVANRNDTFESVYKRADKALYKSKTNGKQHFTIVD